MNTRYNKINVQKWISSTEKTETKQKLVMLSTTTLKDESALYQHENSNGLGFKACMTK